MKLKINWGTGIFIAIVLFMTFILTFVYKSLTPKYSHQLVSENYYKDELNYQKDIDKLNNAINLEKNIALSNSTNGIKIIFPENMDFHKIKGIVYFQRLSDKNADFSKNIDLKSNQMLIPDTVLIKGKWLIKIDWKYNNKFYLLKENWFY